MAKTPLFDPGTSEIRSPLLAGLTEGVSKLSDILGIETTSNTITLQNVKISDTDKNRIYQAAMWNRLWLETPTPIIRKNGSIITESSDNFVIDYVGGSITFDRNNRLEDGDVVTAEVTYCINQSKVIRDIKTAINNLNDQHPVLIPSTVNASDWLDNTAVIQDPRILSGDKYFYILGLSSENVDTYTGGAIWGDDVSSDGKMTIHTQSDQDDDIHFEIIRFETNADTSNDLGAKVISQILGGGGDTGAYAFEVNESGHLILGYTGKTAPKFTLGDNGHLYVDIPPKLDLGKVTSDVYPLDFFSYEGVDLTVKFSSEISNYSDVWAWLKARLTAHDIKDLHIKDYVPVTTKNGYTIICQIADINHDLWFSDSEIMEYHIDFISKDLWPEPHVFNKVAYNNGVNGEPCPWLCSDIYAWLNSKKMQIPNGTTVNPTMENVDYSTSGVFDELPTSLQNVIVERRDFVPQRYSNNGLLSDDNSWGPWKDIGKLWVPNETEVYGQIVWGTRNGYGVGPSHQFPIFLDGKTRIKHLNIGGPRYAWWLRSAYSSSSTGAISVNNDGLATIGGTTANFTGTPVCFRVSG